MNNKPNKLIKDFREKFTRPTSFTTYNPNAREFKLSMGDGVHVKDVEQWLSEALEQIRKETESDSYKRMLDTVESMKKDVLTLKEIVDVLSKLQDKEEKIICSNCEQEFTKDDDHFKKVHIHGDEDYSKVCGRDYCRCMQ